MSTNQARREFGGLINRNKPLNFTFNGKAYSGYEGDTLASALIANGVILTARSFRYHRPRGIFSAGIDFHGLPDIEIGGALLRAGECGRCVAVAVKIEGFGEVTVTTIRQTVGETVRRVDAFIENLAHERLGV